MDWHHITVAVLIVGLVSEAVGGYFDFRLRIVPGPRDHHDPALAVSRLSPNSLWWSIWMKWVSVPDTDAAVETVWRFHRMGRAHSVRPQHHPCCGWRVLHRQGCTDGVAVLGATLPMGS